MNKLKKYFLVILAGIFTSVILLTACTQKSVSPVSDTTENNDINEIGIIIENPDSLIDLYNWVSGNGDIFFTLNPYDSTFNSVYRHSGYFYNGNLYDAGNDSLGQYEFNEKYDTLLITLNDTSYLLTRLTKWLRVEASYDTNNCDLRILNKLGFRYDFLGEYVEFAPADSLIVESGITDTTLVASAYYDSVLTMLNDFYGYCDSLYKDSTVQSYGIYENSEFSWSESGGLIYASPAIIAEAISDFQETPENYIKFKSYILEGRINGDTLIVRSTDISFASQSGPKENWYSKNYFYNRDSVLLDIDYQIYPLEYLGSTNSFYLIGTYPGAEATWYDIHIIKNNQIIPCGHTGWGL